MMERTDRPFADEGEVIATFAGIREQLNRIESQVTRTNGRVQALEMWRSFTKGALAVLTLFLGSGLAWIAFFGGAR